MLLTTLYKALGYICLVVFGFKSNPKIIPPAPTLSIVGATITQWIGNFCEIVFFFFPTSTKVKQIRQVTIDCKLNDSSVFYLFCQNSSMKGFLTLTQYLDLLFSLGAGKVKSNKIIIFILREDLRITSSISSFNLIYLGLAGVV